MAIRKGCGGQSTCPPCQHQCTTSHTGWHLPWKSGRLRLLTKWKSWSTMTSWGPNLNVSLVCAVLPCSGSIHICQTDLALIRSRPPIVYFLRTCQRRFQHTMLTYTRMTCAYSVSPCRQISAWRSMSLVPQVRRASTGSASFDGSIDHLTLSPQRHLYMPSSHLVLTTATPCWPGRQSLQLNRSSGCWMQQLVLSVAPGSSTMAWHSYVTLGCIGWTFLNVSSISLKWRFIDVFKAGSPRLPVPRGLHDCCIPTTVSPAVSIFAVSAATSSSFHDIVAAYSTSGILCCWPDDLELSAWQSPRPNA